MLFFPYTSVLVGLYLCFQLLEPRLSLASCKQPSDQNRYFKLHVSFHLSIRPILACPPYQRFHGHTGLLLQLRLTLPRGRKVYEDRIKLREKKEVGGDGITIPRHLLGFASIFFIIGVISIFGTGEKLFRCVSEEFVIWILE